MGAVFSPTIANIFMSTVLQYTNQHTNTDFSLHRRHLPHLARHYTAFLTSLNTFHPNLRFTHQHSTSTIDFLDLTIYKGTGFHFTNILDTKTFQKPLNLYQYLHFSSYHPRTIFKAFIKGECIRYVRTNTAQETYAT